MDSDDVTELLRRIARGDKSAEEALIPHVYAELRKIAAGYLRRERPDHTLQPTALVSEAYLRLTQGKSVAWHDRAHFFAVAATIMRRVLVDYARQRAAGKRDGLKVPLHDGIGSSRHQDALIMDIDIALSRLEQLSKRQAKVVELRFFSGLTEDECAEVLGVTSRTVKRDWALARAFLYGELGPNEAPE